MSDPQTFADVIDMFEAAAVDLRAEYWYAVGHVDFVLTEGSRRLRVKTVTREPMEDNPDYTSSILIELEPE